jgi:hypothetical protein
MGSSADGSAGSGGTRADGTRCFANQLKKVSPSPAAILEWHGARSDGSDREGMEPIYARPAPDARLRTQPITWCLVGQSCGSASQLWITQGFPDVSYLAV